MRYRDVKRGVGDKGANAGDDERKAQSGPVQSKVSAPHEIERAQYEDANRRLPKNPTKVLVTGRHRHFAQGLGAAPAHAQQDKDTNQAQTQLRRGFSSAWCELKPHGRNVLHGHDGTACVERPCRAAQHKPVRGTALRRRPRTACLA